MAARTILVPRTYLLLEEMYARLQGRVSTYLLHHLVHSPQLFVTLCKQNEVQCMKVAQRTQQQRRGDGEECLSLGDRVNASLVLMATSLPS